MSGIFMADWGEGGQKKREVAYIFTRIAFDFRGNIVQTQFTGIYGKRRAWINICTCMIGHRRPTSKIPSRVRKMVGGSPRRKYPLPEYDFSRLERFYFREKTRVERLSANNTWTCDDNRNDNALIIIMTSRNINCK